MIDSAYPTAYIGGGLSIEFNGTMSEVDNLEYGGTVVGSITCCNPGMTYLPTPSHYPWPSSTGTVDPEDPTGWLYNMHVEIATISGSKAVSSWYAPAQISSVMQYCPYPRCPGMSTMAGATAARSAAGLLITSTVHTTDFSSSTTKEKTPETKSTSASVLVDPQSTTSFAAPKTTTTPTGKGTTGTKRVKTSPANETPTSETPTTQEEPTATPRASSAANPPPVHSQSHHLTTKLHHRPTKTVTGTIPPQPIEVGSTIITPNSNTEYVVSSQTLSPGGPPITVSGTRLSLGSNATLIVEGSQTEVLTTTDDVGGYIWSGIGGSPTTSGVASASGSSSAAPSIVAATGSAQRREAISVIWIWTVLFISLMYI